MGRKNKKARKYSQIVNPQINFSIKNPRTNKVNSWMDSNIGELSKNSHRHSLEMPVPNVKTERVIEPADNFIACDEVKIKNEQTQELIEEKDPLNQDISEVAPTPKSNAIQIFKIKTVRTETKNETVLYDPIEGPRMFCKYCKKGFKYKCRLTVSNTDLGSPIGNMKYFRIFQPLRFYSKSIVVILKPQKLPFDYLSSSEF